MNIGFFGTHDASGYDLSIEANTEPHATTINLTEIVSVVYSRMHKQFTWEKLESRWIYVTENIAKIITSNYRVVLLPMIDIDLSFHLNLRDMERS